MKNEFVDGDLNKKGADGIRPAVRRGCRCFYFWPLDRELSQRRHLPVAVGRIRSISRLALPGMQRRDQVV